MNQAKLKLMAAAALTCSFLLPTPGYTSYSTYQNQFLPHHQHYLSAVQTDGQMIEIDDGSIWRVNRFHARRTAFWATNDVLEISPTYNRTGERFMITNKTRNSYVLAEITNGPLMDSPFTNEVTSIMNGIVYLMSVSGIESRWAIDPRDTFKIAGWDLRQAVIIGKDASSWYSWYPNENAILINIENNDFIRARLF